MLSENFKQFSSNNVDILSNSQNNIKEIHELEKMTNSLSLSSINKNLLETKKDDNKSDADNEKSNSLYKLKNLSQMNKYLSESSNIKLNNNEEFKEYQKSKKDSVNKINNNKIITHKTLNKSSLFNSKVIINELINTNSYIQEKTEAIQDEYLHENPKTEPNPDIIVVSNADDTFVTITESNLSNEKNYFNMNQMKYRTNNINPYNNEYKIYEPISNYNSNDKHINLQNNFEKTFKETQIEIDVT
ncbi:hypothetical protein U3516DRAFT_831101, partial [Neocallimastix sp. 'constans']